MKRKVIHLEGEPPSHLVARCQDYLEKVVIPEALENKWTLVYAISRELARRQQYIEKLSRP